MLNGLRSLVGRLRRRPAQPHRRCTVVMTSQCLADVTEGLSAGVERGHEGIVYFVGLTTGTTTLALATVVPEAATTPGSVDVSATEMGKVVSRAAEAGLQVVGQLHTHPGTAFHSAGDLAGMRIRYPGYISIVVPEYGSLLPSLQQSHTLMWIGAGFQEVDEPISLLREVVL